MRSELVFNLIYSVLSKDLLLLFGFFDGCSEFLLPLLGESFLFLFVLFTKSVLAIHFLLEELVEFFVVFLNVRRDFTFMSFLQGFDSLIVVFVSS